MYSTATHARDARLVAEVLAGVAAPTLFIIRSGDFLFGGFASDQWQFEGDRFGTPKSFLFSLTLDVKVPFHGRRKDAESKLFPADGRGGVQHDCLRGEADHDDASLRWGLHDLVLHGDLSRCSSEIEFSYGFGLPADSNEAKALLAGASVFAVDSMEVWSVV